MTAKVVRGQLLFTRTFAARFRGTVGTLRFRETGALSSENKFWAR